MSRDLSRSSDDMSPKECLPYITTHRNRHIARVKYLHTPIEGQRKPSIVHRDVKSANILLDGDVRARLCDVGLARDVDVGTTMTQGSALGTPGYICPEYQETFEVRSHRSDIIVFEPSVKSSNRLNVCIPVRSRSGHRYLLVRRRAARAAHRLARVRRRAGAADADAPQGWS
jgi:serine/threonine protein kinase